MGAANDKWYGLQNQCRCAAAAGERRKKAKMGAMLLQCNMAHHELQEWHGGHYLPGPGAEREYRSMMVLMPSWQTEQNVSLRSNMMHCISGR